MTTQNCTSLIFFLTPKCKSYPKRASGPLSQPARCLMCSGIILSDCISISWRERERGTVHRQPTKVSQAVLDGGLSSQLIRKAILKLVVAREVCVPQWKVLSILHDNQFHLYHFTLVQALEPQDMPQR